ncbi:MAG: hypothetical protein ORN20_08645, partial [Candidatus Nanopelagicales bacterium]|nr:hypothetical protein [Candidatus Nanopelagicales bacterium]
MNSEEQQFRHIALRAREAAYLLRRLTRKHKDEALLRMADALVANSDQITSANVGDVDRARDSGTSAAIVDRLTLNS